MQTGNQPAREALKPFSKEAKSLAAGDIYEHYSGKQYEIVAVGRNSETLGECAIYRALYGDGDVWVRPLTMFLEEIVIDGKAVPRFKQIR